MIKKYNIGDKVFFLNEIGEGLVTKVLLDNRYMVMDDEGFEDIYASTDLFLPFSKEKYEESDAHEKVVDLDEIEVKKKSVGGFSIGDKVRPVDEDGEGLISDILEEIVSVDMDYGLTMEYHLSKIIKVSDHGDNKMSRVIGDEKHFRKEVDFSKPIKAKKTIRKESGVWEIDLHVHEITEETNNLSAHQLLQIQMDHFESKLMEAINRGVSRIIFIHGRGRGKLRNEIRMVLDRYPNCEYLDGSYQTYGIGATEVIIRRT